MESIKFEKMIDSSGVTHNRKTLKELLDLLFYKPGDTFEIINGKQGINCPGMLSSANKLVFLTLRTPKSMKNVNLGNITIFKANVRGVTGYLGQTAFVEGGYDYLNTSGYTIDFYKIDDYNLKLVIVRNVSFGGTNNTPTTVSLDNFKINFT